MRTALISDIHGNCFALDAALADLDRHPTDAVVCLGDAIQGGAQPAQTVARLRGLGCPVVMGNADAWMLTGVETGAEAWPTQEMQEIRAWSLSQLSASDRAYIESFTPTVELPLDGGEGSTLLCFHGSPTSFDDVILPDIAEADLQRYLGEYQPAIMTGGHTHVQFMRLLGTTFFFNPGSVGMVYDRRQTDSVVKMFPRAEYAVLTSEAGVVSIEFRRLPLDVDALTDVILSSGRPYAESMAAQYRSHRRPCRQQADHHESITPGDIQQSGGSRSDAYWKRAKNAFAPLSRRALTLSPCSPLTAFSFTSAPASRAS